MGRFTRWHSPPDRGRAGPAPDGRAVHDAIADVSVSRIHGYAAELHRFGTKFIGNPGNRQAIEYLSDRLREFGYEPELQWFEPRPGIRSAHVIARLPGTERPDVTVVVGAHFDSDLILYDAHYYENTDAHALYDAFGDVVGGIGSYPMLANPLYHQPHDVLETIDQRLVAEVAKATVGTVMALGRH